MSATSQGPLTMGTGSTTGVRSLHDKAGNARRRGVADVAMHAVLLVAVAAALVPLFLILLEVTRRASGVITWDFLRQTEPISVRQHGGGYVHGIVGTLYMVGIAAAITVPLGILAAVYLVEYGRGMLANVIRFFTDVMTGIPSIFVGLFIFSIFVTQFRFGTLAGALGLGVLMLPIIVRSSEEMLKLVPDELRNASFGLGARRWQTVTRVVLPAASPGLITGSVLAVARGAGETAVLILTALGAKEVVTQIQGVPQASVTLLMFRGATQPFAPGIERAWGGALLLVVLVLLLTILARWISSRSSLAKQL